MHPGDIVFLKARVLREYPGRDVIDVQLLDGQFIQTTPRNLVDPVAEPPRIQEGIAATEDKAPREPARRVAKAKK